MSAIPFIREDDMRTDFDQIEDGATVMLIPNASNPLHRSMVKATYAGGYFYCDGSPHEEGPDYYLGDVARYNAGWQPA
jgi:hypothetical protein